MHLARRLRLALCDTALALGPDAPTLCGPWTVRDLLAHLVLRDRRPDGLPGVGMDWNPLQRHTERVQRSIADQDFAALVQQVRSGPPRWSPVALVGVDKVVNTTEYVVHLQDIVRAQPGWAPQPTDDRVEAAAWAALPRVGRLSYRSSPVGVVLLAPGHGRALVRRPPAGTSSVVVTGPPLELLLHAFGRTGVAQVTVDGEPSAVAALDADERAV
jgi:uncharacterized protein (TIGR03085 family)